MKTHAIFFSFDKNYVIPAAVTFESLLANTSADIFYDLFVLHQDIPKTSQGRLQDIVKKHGNGALTFVHTAHLLEDIEFDNTHFSTGDSTVTFTIETMLRCIPDLIPEFDRFDTILYSDVDIIVTDDISELFEIGLGSNYLAAPHTPKFLDYQIEHLDSKFIGHYFGGGLWLMNLKKMRGDGLGHKVIQIIKNPPCRLLWNDQDVMNLACDFKTQNLSYRYVSIPTWLPWLDSLNFKDDYYPNRELEDALYRPKIMHFAYLKPWKATDISGARLWFYWLGKAGFTLEEFPDSMKPAVYSPSLLERLLYPKLIGLSFLLMLSCVPLLGKLVKDRYSVLRNINKKMNFK